MRSSSNTDPTAMDVEAARGEMLREDCLMTTFVHAVSLCMLGDLSWRHSMHCIRVRNGGASSLCGVDSFKWSSEGQHKRVERRVRT